MALKTNVIQAMLIIGELPSLLSLRRTLEGGIFPGLTIRVVTAYGRKIRGEKNFSMLRLSKLARRPR